MALNAIRFCGDMSRLLSIILLIRRLRSAQNAQGISLRTQELFLMFVLARYTDLFTTFYGLYNSVMKILFIGLQFWVIYLMRCHGPISSTYDREQDNFRHLQFLVLPGAVVAIAYYLIFGNGLFYFKYSPIYGMQELLWSFSIVLESVAILPQLYLLRRYRIIENLTGNYVFFMGIYRFLYILNWVYRSRNEPGYRHHIGVYVCGCLQVMWYIEFFYWYIKCKMSKKALRYGGEGDTEYYDCNVDGLRNGENSLPLVDQTGDLRMRGKQEADENDDQSPLLVV